MALPNTPGPHRGLTAAELLGADAPPLPLSPIDKVTIHDVDMLDDDLCVVEWSYLHSGFVTRSLVSCEYEGKDPSVGYFSGYWYGSGDCPKAVEEAAAEAASLRAADNEPDGDADWDSRGDYEDDADDREPLEYGL